MNHVLSHNHLAVFPGAVIVLNLNKGRYFIYGRTVAEGLQKFLKQEGRPPIELLDDKALSSIDVSIKPGTIHQYESINFNRFDSSLWSARDCNPPLEEKIRASDLLALTLHVMMLRTVGFRLLTLIPRKNNKVKQDKSKSREDIACIVTRLQCAALWCPFQVRCLEWALALTWKLRANGFASNLVIGVRPFPFIAHAWVEIDRAIIGDSSDLRRIYGVIFISSGN